MKGQSNTNQELLCCHCKSPLHFYIHPFLILHGGHKGLLCCPRCAGQYPAILFYHLSNLLKKIFYSNRNVPYFQSINNSYIPTQEFVNISDFQRKKINRSFTGFTIIYMKKLIKIENPFSNFVEFKISCHSVYSPTLIFNLILPRHLNCSNNEDYCNSVREMFDHLSHKWVLLSDFKVISKTCKQAKCGPNIKFYISLTARSKLHIIKSKKQLSLLLQDFDDTAKIISFCAGLSLPLRCISYFCHHYRSKCFLTTDQTCCKCQCLCLQAGFIFE